MASIKQQATQSVLWSAIERFSVQGAQYIIGIIIARLLAPEAYGLIAMLSVFIAISQTFIDGGFANALIQKKDRTDVDYSTVFYFNIALAVILYLILFASAPYIADFYNESALDLITKVVGLTLIINSFGIVQQAKLTVALDFKRQAFASLTAVVISGCVGVWMAYNEYGVWTLVWHSLLNNLLRVILLWVFARWSPMLNFSVESFKTLFSFGSKLLLSSLLHTIYANIYTLIIGKKFASVELGYYNRAVTLSQFPSTNLTNVIVRAVYPIQCRMQDDHEGLNKLFVNYLRMACYVVFPIMIGLCVLAQPLVSILLTDKWLPIVPLVQILCVAYMWDPVMKINHNMLNVKGRSDFFLRAEIFKKIVAVAILLVTIPLGIKVMCMGLVAYSFADMIIISFFTRKLTGIGIFKQIKELAPVVLLSFSMGAVAYITSVQFSSSVIQVLVGTGAGVIYYGGLSHLFKFREFGQFKSLITKR